MGGSRTELTRLALTPLQDLEVGLFVPVDESEFAYVLKSAQQEANKKDTVPELVGR